MHNKGKVTYLEVYKGEWLNPWFSCPVVVDLKGKIIHVPNVHIYIWLKQEYKESFINLKKTTTLLCQYYAMFIYLL